MAGYGHLKKLLKFEEFKFQIAVTFFLEEKIFVSLLNGLNSKKSAFNQKIIYVASTAYCYMLM